MPASPLVLVYATYLVAAASPGPSNMAIMGTAMRDGRGPALVLAAGVMTGSLFWAILAATGISAVLATYAQALYVIKILGGIYLLFLAYRAGRSALRSEAEGSGGARRLVRSYPQLYRQGAFMHIGNPKAVLAWVAIMSLGLRPGASGATLPAIIGGCALLGLLTFGGYAVIFSTRQMVTLYGRLRRWIEGGLCALFAAAGLTLITSGR